METQKYTYIDIENSDMKLIHRDTLGINVSVVEETYKAKYVGEFSLRTKNGNWTDQSAAIFHTEIAHPQGSNFFALYYMYDYDFLINSKQPKLYITNGISAVTDKNGNPVVYEGVVCEDRCVLYSAYHHDYQTYKDFMMDGGREYSRYSGSKIVKFAIDSLSGKIILKGNV